MCVQRFWAYNVFTRKSVTELWWGRNVRYCVPERLMPSEYYYREVKCRKREHVGSYVNVAVNNWDICLPLVMTAFTVAARISRSDDTWRRSQIMLWDIAIFSWRQISEVGKLAVFVSGQSFGACCFTMPYTQCLMRAQCTLLPGSCLLCWILLLAVLIKPYKLVHGWGAMCLSWHQTNVKKTTNSAKQRNIHMCLLVD